MGYAPCYPKINVDNGLCYCVKIKIVGGLHSLKNADDVNNAN